MLQHVDFGEEFEICVRRRRDSAVASFAKFDIRTIEELDGDACDDEWAVG